MTAKKAQMKYTDTQISEFMEKLRALPKIEISKSHSKQETVNILKKEIADLKKRGYTLEQISESLTGIGLEVSTATLKNYLQRSKPTKQTPKTETMDQSPQASKVSEKFISEAVDKSTFSPRPDRHNI